MLRKPSVLDLQIVGFSLRESDVRGDGYQGKGRPVEALTAAAEEMVGIAKLWNP